jgi:hypothetical protein
MSIFVKALQEICEICIDSKNCLTAKKTYGLVMKGFPNVCKQCFKGFQKSQFKKI